MPIFHTIIQKIGCASAHSKQIHQFPQLKKQVRDRKYFEKFQFDVTRYPETLAWFFLYDFGIIEPMHGPNAIDKSKKWKYGKWENKKTRKFDTFSRLTSEVTILHILQYILVALCKSDTGNYLIEINRTKSA